jgi:hypothetical protein
LNADELLQEVGGSQLSLSALGSELKEALA